MQRDFGAVDSKRPIFSLLKNKLLGPNTSSSFSPLCNHGTSFLKALNRIRDVTHRDSPDLF